MNRVIAAQTDPQTARSHWVMGRRDSERAFRDARRHSRLVRVLRIAVPIAVVAGCVIMFLITYFNPLRMLAKLPINLNDLIVSGTKVTMEQPRMSGFTRDSRAYQVSAEAAAQDLTKPDLVELRNIHAQVEMQDKSTMKMSANNGIYNSKNDTLQLQNNILLSSSGGYSGRLSEALVNTRSGNVVSNQPVELRMLQGTLNANKLEIVDSGDLVRFHDGVVMDLMLNPPAAAPEKKADAK
jgi:lipopolysaccharide export system protein LptC